MKKTTKIWIVLMAILISVIIIQQVRADTVMITDIITTEQVSTVTNVNTPESTYVWINGIEYTNIPEYIDENEDNWNKDKGIDFSGIVNHIKYGVNHLLYGDDATRDEIEIIHQLDRVFAKDITAFILQARIDDLEHRIEALEKTIEQTNKEAYCRGKMDIAVKYNLKGFTCENKEFRLIDGSIIGIEPAQ